jgi:hypothetical protein
MDDMEISVSSVVVELCQNGNTNGSTQDVEDMTVRFESPTFIDEEGSFMVITTAGWSIDSGADLGKVLDKLTTVVNRLHGLLNAKEGGGD